ncbi:hypothetical protein DEI91_03155 [Curtobacterium sp. MCBD17_032]|nr:hypothetical protein DEI91_03155 [Curtobacterium sp. MCBD17_032]
MIAMTEHFLPTAACTTAVRPGGTAAGRVTRPTRDTTRARPGSHERSAAVRAAADGVTATGR